MTKFHIKANGEPGRCVAKQGNCRFGSDDEHHSTKDTAREAYEKKNATISLSSLTKASIIDQSEISSGPASKAARLDRALESDLIYDGPTHKWLEDMREESDAIWHGSIDEQPRIIDVVDYSDGKLAVVWSPYSLASNDNSIQTERGYTIKETAFIDIKTGRKIGYLKSSFVDDSSAERSYGNDDYSSIRYMDETDGSSFGMRVYLDDGPSHDPTTGKRIPSKRVSSLSIAETPEEILEAKKKIWADSHRALHLQPNSLTNAGEHIESRNLELRHSPNTEAEIEEDLKQVREITDVRYSDWKKDFSTPYIDFSRMGEVIKGTGLGSSLYIYTARMLGKEGKILRGSGIQTGDANNVWERFAKNDKLPVKKYTQRWSRSKPQEGFALDFRDRATK